MKYDNELIGKKILEERTKLGLSQVELGKKIGTVGKQISNYEKGKPIPPINIMLKLCNVFNCELGYLLGEPDYSEGTKIETAIFNATGLTVNTMNTIRKITGTEKSCLSFGHEAESYRSILNALFSSSLFLNLIERLHELDSAVTDSKNMWKNVEEKIGKKHLNEGFGLYDSTIGYGYDPEAPKLTPEQYKAIKAIDTAIDKEYKLSDRIKMARYELHEAFENLIESLYPRNE